MVAGFSNTIWLLLRRTFVHSYLYSANTNMSNDKEWRRFEKLVARIERVLAPKGAIVKSPDKIEDILTGSLREVDASIRMKVGQFLY